MVTLLSFIVKPAITLAETRAPDGAPVTLIEHDGEFSLHSGGVQLESSFAHNGAAELGRLAAQPFRSARQPRILVAGLGLGFVLSGLRQALPQKRAVFYVSEPLPDLPEWHHRHLATLHEGLLDDPRLVIRREALTEALRKDKEGWQALVIDADSSLPQAGVTSRGGLPHSSFLHRAHSSLKDGGLLALACSAEHRSFERKIQRAGFDVVFEVVPTSQKGKQKQRSTIWLARKGAYEPRRAQRSPQK